MISIVFSISSAICNLTPFLAASSPVPSAADSAMSMFPSNNVLNKSASAARLLNLC